MFKRALQDALDLPASGFGTDRDGGDKKSTRTEWNFERRAWSRNRQAVSALLTDSDSARQTVTGTMESRFWAPHSSALVKAAMSCSLRWLAMLSELPRILNQTNAATAPSPRKMGTASRGISITELKR